MQAWGTANHGCAQNQARCYDRDYRTTQRCSVLLLAYVLCCQLLEYFVRNMKSVIPSLIYLKYLVFSSSLPCPYGVCKVKYFWRKFKAPFIFRSKPPHFTRIMNLFASFNKLNKMYSTAKKNICTLYVVFASQFQFKYLAWNMNNLIEVL